MAYKPIIYGDTITVLRTIGNTSLYKIKSSKGKISLPNDSNDYEIYIYKKISHFQEILFLQSERN